MDLFTAFTGRRSNYDRGDNAAQSSIPELMIYGSQGWLAWPKT